MKALARCIAAVLIAAPLAAHDFWIQPSSFRVAKDTLLNVALLVGDFGKGDEVERKQERSLRFVAAGPDGEKAIVGRDGATPAGFLRPKSEGLYVLGFQSNHASVTLEAQKFMSYLDERGLDSIRRLREQRGESAKPARELYSRSAKSIVQVGERTETAWSGFDKRLELTLELTPAKDPYRLARAEDGARFEPLPIQLTFQGKPLTGALVGALNLDAPPLDAGDTTHVLRARSDEHGRVSFEFPRSGRWLLAAVHMLPLEGNPEADYESFWGSLTFEVVEPAG